MVLVDVTCDVGHDGETPVVAKPFQLEDI